MNLERFTKFIKPYFWRVIFTIAGFIAAMSFLVIGFTKTALILTCCLLGYIIGWIHDNNIRLTEIVRNWRARR